MNRGCLGQLVPGSSFRLVPAAVPRRSWPECRLVPAAAPEPPIGLYRQPSLGLYRQPPPASLPACTGSRPRAARRLIPAAAPGSPAGLYRQPSLGCLLDCTGSCPWVCISLCFLLFPLIRRDPWLSSVWKPSRSPGPMEHECNKSMNHWSHLVKGMMTTGAN